MSNKQWIVVYDPSNDYWEGSIVDETRAGQLESRGVVLLPTTPDLFRASGVGAFHKRSWGAGWPLNTASPRIASPLTMFCDPSLGMIHWAARLIPEDGVLEKLEQGEKVAGFVRFAIDASQANPLKAGLSPQDPVNLQDFNAQDLVEGGFHIRGSGKVTLPGVGHYGFALYGMAPGLRVAWAAVSQSAA